MHDMQGGRWWLGFGKMEDRRGAEIKNGGGSYPELKGQNRNLDGSDFTDDIIELNVLEGGTNSGLVCQPECFVSRTASLPPFPPSPLCDHVPCLYWWVHSSHKQASKIYG